MKYNYVCHFDITVPNFLKARNFYTNVFGWEVNYVPKMDYATFMAGDKPYGGFRKGKPKKGQSVIVYIAVSNMDETLKRIKRNGGKIKQKKTEVFPIGWQATFFDPFGNLLGLFQASGKRGMKVKDFK